MHTYSKKLAGTSALLMMVAAIAFVASPNAFARFINFGSYYTADGMVTAVGANTITIATNGSNPITLSVTGDTRFAANGDISDVEVGDDITAKFYDRGGTKLAQTVRVSKVSYGNTGPRVFVQWGYVKSKGGSSFTVEIKPGVLVTFQVDSDTSFHGLGVTNLAQLSVNDTVAVSGTDTGSAFLAKKVYLQQSKGQDVFNGGDTGTGNTLEADQGAADADQDPGFEE